MIHRRLHPLMIMMLLAGCAVGPDYQPPAPPAVTHWNDKGDSAVKSQTTSAATNPRWWKTFGSPQLDSLVERAIAGNLTLQQTVLRIAGAREQINQAGGAFYPSVNGNLQATRQQLGLELSLRNLFEAADLAAFARAASALTSSSGNARTSAPISVTAGER